MRYKNIHFYLEAFPSFPRSVGRMMNVSEGRDGTWSLRLDLELPVSVGQKASSADLEEGKLAVTVYVCTRHFNITLDMQSGLYFKYQKTSFSFIKNIADIHLGLIFNLLDIQVRVVVERNLLYKQFWQACEWSINFA